MSNILSEIQDYRERKMMESKIIVADKSFLSNIDKIKRIRKTEWYLMIKDYWTRKFNLSLERVKKVDASKVAEVAKTQALLELSQEFLTFLNAYEEPLVSTLEKKKT